MNDDKNDTGSENKAPLTSGRLHDMVLDHILENPGIFLANESGNAVEHFKATLESLVQLAHTIASESLANRQCLSPITTFDSVISSSPDDDETDSARYEMKYRLVEQIGDDQPYKDSVMSYSEAEEIYGESFIENYWGRLGERCPQKVSTPGNRNLWFTVVRLPAIEQELTNAVSSTPTMK